MLLEKTEPFEPKYGSIIDYVDVLDHMHLEMDMIIHSFPSNDWGNILQVGIENGDRLPALMIHPEADNSGHPLKGFYIVVKDGPGMPASGGMMGDALALNQMYHIELDFTQTHFTVVVNGQTLFDDVKTEHTHHEDMPCYSGFPVHSAADVTISNLIMWSSDLFPTVNAAAQQSHGVVYENGGSSENSGDSTILTIWFSAFIGAVVVVTISVLAVLIVKRENKQKEDIKAAEADHVPEVSVSTVSETTTAVDVAQVSKSVTSTVPAATDGVEIVEMK